MKCVVCELKVSKKEVNEMSEEFQKHPAHKDCFDEFDSAEDFLEFANLENLSYEKKIEHLEELLDEEHPCDQSNCGISKAREHGFILWAIVLFSSTGASSKSFDKLFKSLPGTFHQTAEVEREKFVETVPNINCPHCNAAVYDYEDCEYSCDNCGKEALFSVKVEGAGSPDGVDSEKIWSNDFCVVGESNVEENSCILKVAMKYGKEPSEITKQDIENSLGVEMPNGAKIKVLG